MRWEGRSALHQLEIACPGDGLGAAGDTEFAEDVVGVALDRTHRDHERPSDLGIGLAGRDQVQHVQFAGTERLLEILDFGFWILDWEPGGEELFAC